MITYNVRVTQEIIVTLEESKFDETFMKEFQENFYSFITLDEHAQHLAQLYARGLADNYSFIEGYGPAQDMNIKFKEKLGKFDVEIVKNEA